MEPVRVSFPCRAYTLAGHLYTPPAVYTAGEDEGEEKGGSVSTHGYGHRRGAAVVVCPPWTGVKEQAPAAYARLLAAAGFTVLTYDAVFQGESSGEPRYLEDPSQRVEDIKAAVTYLHGRDDLVDARRIGVLGICASGGYACTAAQTDVRIRAVATVSAVCVGAMARRGLEQDLSAGTESDNESVSSTNTNTTTTSSMTILQARLEVASYDRNSDISGRRIGTMHVLPQNYDPRHPPAGMSESFRDLASYYRTERGRHPRATNTCLPRSWDLMANYDAFRWNSMIAPRPLLAVAGGRAATRWFSEDAVRRARGDRNDDDDGPTAAGLLVVDGMSHADLFDHVDVAGARLVEYFGRFLGSWTCIRVIHVLFMIL